MAADTLDAVVVGSGPNGLAAAITLAEAGMSVHVLEGAATPGGGTRSAELTVEGFVHDVCSAVHPLVSASPFFRSLDLAALGIELLYPRVALAHPLDAAPSVLLAGTTAETARGLGPDEARYRRLVGPFAGHVDELIADVLSPTRIPAHPLLFAHFGVRAVWSAHQLATVFATARARALIGGLGAHSMLPLTRTTTASIALVLAVLGNGAGWPVVRGGSQAIPDALVARLRTLGGDVACGRTVRSLADLPPSRVVLFDTGPHQLAAIAGAALPARYASRLRRFRYGPGVFKVDWALSRAIPWRDPGCTAAGTVHLGGTLEEVASGEAAVWRGVHPDRPFVILAQPGVVDGSRAPAGQQAAWAYCHVPSGSTVDMTARIEAQVERFAPGFRDIILGRATMSAVEVERYNPNDVGGDINGGVQDLRQLFTRPVARLTPYSTPNPRLWICSSSTPPGGGVHGMCGVNAARALLRAARQHR